MLRTAKSKLTNSPLVGRRVFLRRPAQSDRGEFIALTRASLKSHKRWVTPPTNTKTFADYLKRARHPEWACFLIFRRGDGAILGAMTLAHIILRNFQNAYLGYFIGVRFTRQGYATEAMQLMLRHAFRELK